MIAAIALAAANVATMPNERVYRLAVHGNAGAHVAVRAEGPPGWLETFCTPHVCAIRHAMMKLPESGTSVALVHVYRIKPGSAREGVVSVEVAGARVLRLTLRYLSVTRQRPDR